MRRLARLLPLRSVGTVILCTLALTLPASSAPTFTYTDSDGGVHGYLATT
jgi:hypothetical protein